MRDSPDNDSAKGAENIGLCSGIIAIRASVTCRADIAGSDGISDVRFAVAGHCIVFAYLVSFAKTRRPDLRIDDFAESILRGMSRASVMSEEGTSTYADLIISDLEMKLFRKHLVDSLRTESAINDFLFQSLSVTDLFRGLAYFRENLFRSSQLGDEAGLARRLSVALVANAESWLIPLSWNPERKILFLDKFLGAISSGYLFTLCERILALPKAPIRKPDAPTGDRASLKTKEYATRCFELVAERVPYDRIIPAKIFLYDANDQMRIRWNVVHSAQSLAVFLAGLNYGASFREEQLHTINWTFLDRMSLSYSNICSVVDLVRDPKEIDQTLTRFQATGRPLNYDDLLAKRQTAGEWYNLFFPVKEQHMRDALKQYMFDTMEKHPESFPGFLSFGPTWARMVHRSVWGSSPRLNVLTENEISAFESLYVCVMAPIEALAKECCR